MLFALGGMAGLALFVINGIGMRLPLRSPDVDRYVDFAGSQRLGYEEAARALEKLSRSDLDRKALVTEATRIFHRGMAHIDLQDIRVHGLEHYRMRVPVWENYLLWLLSYLKPDTYRDYEFCSYPKALERGTGRCGQQSMALVGYLSEQGLDTGFVRLGGHTVATARVREDEWYMLDADFGGVIPFGLATAEEEPARVLEFYWSETARQRELDELFHPAGNSVAYGGPNARYARGCPLEQVAYAAKWGLPSLRAGSIADRRVTSRGASSAPGVRQSAIDTMPTSAAVAHASSAELCGTRATARQAPGMRMAIFWDSGSSRAHHAWLSAYHRIVDSSPPWSGTDGDQPSSARTRLMSIA